MKIGLFMLLWTTVQLEWLEVATVWHLGDTGRLDFLEDAIWSVARTTGCPGLQGPHPPPIYP